MSTLFFVVNQLRSSGPIKVLLDICRNLNRSQYDIRIITLMKDDGKRSLASAFSSIGIPIINYSYSFWELELQTNKVAKQIAYIAKSEPDPILHAHGYHPTLILSRISEIPTVTTIHNISSEDYVRSKGFILGHYMSLRFKLNLRHIEFPVAISAYMKQYYSHYHQGIQVICNGVQFRREPLNRNQICTSLGITSSKLIVLVTGHLSKLKNPSFVVKELKNSKNDFMCVFVGAGSELQKCQIIANGDLRFNFVGYVTNVYDYLSVADVFVSASFTEGMPLAVLEALNMGVPSLLSEIPAHVEIANVMNMEEVKTFPLVPGELTKQFDNFISHTYDHSVIEDRAKEFFSASSMAERYSLLYLSIFNQYAKSSSGNTPCL